MVATRLRVKYILCTVDTRYTVAKKPEHVPIREFRAGLATYLERARHYGERFIIEKRTRLGEPKPMAALVPVEDLEGYEAPEPSRKK